MRFVPLVFSVAAMALIWMTDLPRLLGAHPWWSGNVVLVGTAVGLVLAHFAKLTVRPAIALGLFACFGLFSFWIAWSGKTGFAASYAEDQFAGQMWYFGWIGVSVAICGVLFAIGQLVARKV